MIGDEIDIDYKYTTAPYGIGNNQALLSAGTDTYQLVLLGANNVDSPSTSPVNGFYYKYFATGTAKRLESEPIEDTWYNIKVYANGEVVSNGTSIISSPEEELDGTNTSLFLFIRRNLSAPFLGAIKKFKLIRNNTIIIHLIPCKDLNGVVCMYDKVSERFFYNQGTGDFIAGPIVT